jgi:hypothetical protein
MTKNTSISYGMCDYGIEGDKYDDEEVYWAITLRSVSSFV